MKRFMHIIACVLVSYAALSFCTKECELKLEPLWTELQDEKEKSITFDGKWIHAGTITFQKRILDTITLDKIILTWHGPAIDHLNASLYATEINKPFKAIDDMWVADGQWSELKQQLIFRFQDSCHLCSSTHFHLVLTVPRALEEKLKRGFFTLDSFCLPPQYQDSPEDARTLSFNAFTKPVLCS